VSNEAPETNEPIDYRSSPVGRRRSWYGLKRHAKRALGWRAPNWVLRQAVRVRPALAASGRLPAPAYVREVKGHVDGASFAMLRPDRCVVAKELYWGRGHRPRPQDQFALEMFAKLAGEADVMLDIGAYTGIFTLVGTGASAALHAHAFELVPEVYRALFDNCVRNGILHRVTLHHEGIGTDGDTMTIPVAASDSALPDFFSRSLHFSEGIQVRLVSLDSLILSMPAAARIVVKVDVEGTENEIFSRGGRFLAAFRPDIVCEVLDGVADARGLEELLAPYDYRHYVVREHDLLLREHIETDIRYRDWLFTGRSAEELRSAGIPVTSTARGN
jgi:FkbM family methyltransferase